MSLAFRLDPPVTPALRDGILDLWTDVANTGGAVGFVAPVTGEDIRPALVTHFVAMAKDQGRLLVGHDDEGRVAATGFFGFDAHQPKTPWVWLYTVMVHPRHQGKGHGRDLLAAAADAARTFDGIEAIRLTCRGGTGLERFYGSCGYQEVGRVNRDDVIMLLPVH